MRVFFLQKLCIISVMFSVNLTAQNVSVDLQTIKQSIKKAEYFLVHLQQTNGLISDTVNPLFDLWETTLAANALYYNGEDSSTKKSVTKAYTALIGLSGIDANKHLICHNTKCKASYCIETSAFFQVFETNYKKKIKATAGVLQLKNLQKPSGEWEVGNPDVQMEKTFPSVTAFALWSLETNKLKPKYEKEAYAFLVSKQKTDGSFGQTWEYYNTPAYALWIILTLKQFKKEYPKECAKAYQYIFNSQNGDGSWYYKDSSNLKNTSAELQTSLMLLSLLNAEKSSVASSSVTKAIHFLLTHQASNGSWEGGYFPINNARYQKKEYVMATAQALLALKIYLFLNHE